MKVKYFVCGVLTAVIVIAFFLPWVHVESQAIDRITEALTGGRQSRMIQVSGFDIPILANSSDARLIISIVKLFRPDITNVDKKSWLVWSIPILAVIIFLLNLSMKNNKWFNLTVAIIGLLIFSVGVYKIGTTNLDRLVFNARIGSGIWLTLWGYLGLGLIGTVNSIKLLATNKKK